MAKRADKSDRPDDTPATFESALEELEDIVRKMEAGDVALDESLTLYERGRKLVAHCQGKLDHAEKQIEELGRGDDGKLEAKPLDESKTR